MKNKNQYVPYAHYLKREQELRQIQRQGVKLIFKKNWFKLIGGCACIGVGVLTLPFPTGSILLIGLGFYLLGLSSADFIKYRDVVIRQIKVKLRRVFKR